MAALTVYTPPETAIVHTTQTDFVDRDTFGTAVHLVQGDDSIPVIAVEMYEHGVPYVVPEGAEGSIRWKKPDPDRHFVYNPLLGLDQKRTTAYIEVDQQMVATPGFVDATIEIMIGGSSHNSQRLPIIIDENPIKAVDLESTTEGKALLEYVEEAQKSATSAGSSATAAASSAEKALASQNAAATSASEAKASQTAAAASQTAAATSEKNAKASQDAAAASESAASASQTAAKTSQDAAAASATAASESASAAAASQEAALTSQTAAKASENAAATSASEAATSAIAAKNSETAAATSASEADISETAAAESAASAKEEADRAKGYADTIHLDYDYIEETRADVEKNAAAAASSETAAKASEDAAVESASAAQASQTAAKTFQDAAAASATASATSASQAASSASAASTSEKNAKASEDSAAESASSADIYAKQSQSYADGTAGVREGEKIDNSKYYYEQAKRIAQGLQGSLLPMGTIAFAALDAATKQPGYMYNISDSFTTDARFKDGSGHLYPAGTNVYYTADGYWDCLAGYQVTSVNGETGAVTVKVVKSSVAGDYGATSLTIAGTANNEWIALTNVNSTLFDTATIAISKTDGRPHIDLRKGSVGVSEGRDSQMLYTTAFKPTAGEVGALPATGTAVSAAKVANALSFSGGFTGTYDGSKALSVPIPTVSYPVTSVNSKTGAVTLGANDIKFTDGETFQAKLDAGELKGATGAQGPKGATGPQGPAGAAATINIGTVTTGDPGTSATVTNAGTTSAAKLNFTIPRGATGAQGPKGDTGATGAQGPKGDTGATGSTGPAGPNSVSASTTSSINGIIKGASGKLAAAAAGTDYVAPSTLNSYLKKTGDTGGTVTLTGALVMDGSYIQVGKGVGSLALYTPASSPDGSTDIDKASSSGGSTLNIFNSQYTTPSKVHIRGGLKVDSTIEGTATLASTALKTNNSLTFTGAVTGSWNGSSAKTVNIPSAPSASTHFLTAHPVGSYYLANSSTSPASTYGGTWSQESTTPAFVEQSSITGSNNVWDYRKWSNGLYEGWYKMVRTGSSLTLPSSASNWGYGVYECPLPSGLTSVISAQVTSGSDGITCTDLEIYSSSNVASTDNKTIRAVVGALTRTSLDYWHIYFYIQAKWKTGSTLLYLWRRTG